MNESILSKYSRNPKHYVELPSKGYYYQEQIIDCETKEIPVRAMTARDELMLKNPDALLNGDAITRIIKSCVPEIKDPTKMVTPDVEVILLAIFSASYGDDLEFRAKCPECKHENDFTASIETLLGTIKHLEPPYKVDVDHEIEGQQVKMSLYVRPLNYGTSTKNSMIQLENAKIIQVLTSSDLDETEKLEKFGDSFDKIATMNFETVASCIDKIEVPEGTVTDREEINEFISNVDTHTINKINKKIKEINDSIINNNFTAKCQKCEHEWTTKIEFDPARFFVSKSKD